MPLSLSRIKKSFSCYVLLVPTFLLLSVFSFVPFYWAFSTSFYQYEIGEEPTSVGLSNYREYLADPTFLPSFSNMAFLTFFAVCVNVVFPLTVAKLIFSLSSERARYYYRIAFLAPIVVPYVAVQMIWVGLVYGDAGLVNELLQSFGLGDVARGWLSNPRTVLWAIAFVGFPFANGINVLIYYAGLSNISQSVHEAAWLDGARGLGKFLRVDIPLVLSQIKLLVILTLIAGIQGFEGVFILTRGGPGFKSMVPGLWMYYNAFSFQRMGQACAIGVVLFFLILGFTILNLKYFKSAENIQAAE